MVRRHYNLPRLATLVAFEAAARHLSLKHAAAELNVTPGAISHQIKSLEAELGVPLFNRVHRGVELTPSGDELFGALSRSFQQTSATLQHIRDAGKHRAVTIGATTAVAALWLLPRVGAFWRAHPEVSINHRVSDHDYELNQEGLDIALRYGSGDWQGQASQLIFSDEIVPVCSPAFADRHLDVTPEQLARLPLIDIDSSQSQRTTWNDWFQLSRLETRRINGPVFNNYVIALQAAEDGAGVILGWWKLIEPITSRRGLVRLTDAGIGAPGSFYLTWDQYYPLTKDAALVRDWLVHEAEHVGTESVTGSIEFY